MCDWARAARSGGGVRRFSVAAGTVLLGMAWVLGGAPLRAAASYRDLKVYTTSTQPATAMPASVVARTQFVNSGPAPLAIEAELKPDPAAGFAGAKFAATIPPGKDGIWTWSFDPPEGMQREILVGQVRVNGQAERDLFIGVQGRDPASFRARDRIEVITEPGRVVATYAPRTRQAVLAAVKSAQADRGKPALVLAENGKSDYAIVVEALPAPKEGAEAMKAWQDDKGLPPAQRDLVDAVDDLQRCLRIQSGATLPVAAALPAGKPGIRIRKVDALPGAKGVGSPNATSRVWGPLQDAYRLRTDGRDVVIESDTLDGLRQGVYGLLTDHLDCHWFQPRQLGEEIVVPPDRAVRLPKLDETRGSKWASCGGASWGNDPRWDRRNRALINRGRINFGHSWYNYININEFPYDKFPDYYARDREGKVRKRDEGWTSTNFCSTNPKVIEIVAKKINAFFDANPDAIVCSIDPNDYAPMCLCENCLALDKKYGVTKLDGTEVADRLLHFSKEIYDRLEPKNKGKFLGILIYGYQMELPKGAQAHEHHAGTICNFPPRYDHSRPWDDPTSQKNRDFFRLVKGWGSMLKQFGYYDYYGHYYYFGPFGVVHKMREDLPAFHDLGGTFLVFEAQPNFAGQGLNHYVAGRLAWDVDADVDVLLEEFFQKYYGPAAEPMRNYWLTAEKHFALERPGTGTEMRVAARPEFWNELDGCLKQAEAIVAKLPAEQKRFADRVALARMGFDYGRIRAEYDLNYGRRGGRGGRGDHAAALRFFQANQARLEALQGHHPADDPYWPALVPNYFVVDFAKVRSRLEAAVKSASTQPVGELDE